MKQYGHLSPANGKSLNETAPMHSLLADIGNSSIKLIALDAAANNFTPDQVTRIDRNLPPEQWRSWLQQVSPANRPTRCYIASVNAPIRDRFCKQLQQSLGGIECRAIAADDLSMETNVESRVRLGIDRLLAATAALEIARHTGSTQRPVIVIDAGTATTIDLVNQNGTFEGGVIFPGSDTSFHALQQSTAALPKLNASSQNESFETLVGTSTESAIVRGVLSAQAFGIRGIVAHISQRQSVPPVVVATGGGIAPIRPLLPDECDGWNYMDHLVLRALHSNAPRWNSAATD